MQLARNVRGGPLAPCSSTPLTGFYRNGCCDTDAEDTGVHTVCIVATADFLAFSRSVGNDLSTPMPQYRFPGLKPGDRWCLCAARWQQAFEMGYAPPVVMESTHEVTLGIIDLEDLEKFAV